MSSEDETTLVTKGLDALITALKVEPPRARVGILGDKTLRKNATKGAAANNATIGAAHEFGTSKLPQRSFLRVPITDNLAKKMESSGALDKDVLAEVIREKSLLSWMKKVAVLAEGIVLEAFDTGGFGKWKPSDMTKKKLQQTLVETQQLRNSITSEVKE